MELRNKTLSKKRELYTTILGQSFSPCNKFLACSSHLGRISVFHIAPTLTAELTSESVNPYFSFEVPQCDQILSLTSSQELLAGGSSNGNIYIWNWSDVIEKKSEDVVIFRIPSSNIFNSCSEINCVHFSDDGTKLYSGGGDGLIHVWDVATKEHLHKLQGHSDSVLCMDVTSQKIFSGSEDGFVKVWETRTGNSPIREMLPSSDKNCSREHLGKWIKCLTVVPGRDWIVCGGGPHLSLWHEDYKASLCTFVAPDVLFNDVIHDDGMIISGGNEAMVRHWSINGKEEACVPCTPTNVFSITVNNANKLPKILSVAGNCNKIDICTNFNYRAFSLQVV